MDGRDLLLGERARLADHRGQLARPGDQDVPGGEVAADERPVGVEDRTGPAMAAAECRYVLYDDGATYTFSDDDVFAGITAFTWWDWEADGYTRAEVTEIILAEEYTVRLAEVRPDGRLGPFVELDLVQTPVKYHVVEGQGLTAYRVTGVVLDLDPGTYVTHLAQSSPYWPGEDYEATVTLVVTD